MNKVVVITGGSDGIGESLCYQFGRKGYTVVFTGRDQGKIEKVSAKLAALQVKNLGLPLDASIDEDNQQLVQNTIDQFGRIDVLICNAGVSQRGLFKETSLAVMDKIIDINFRGAVSVIKHALPHLMDVKGALIGISSINGKRATPARTAYVAGKHALEGFLESLRMELFQDQVHVMVVRPYFTNTNMRYSAIMKDGSVQGESKNDEDKWMSPDTVARATYMGLKRKRRVVTMSFMGKLVLFLNHFFPALMDRMVFRYMSKKPDSPFYKDR